MIQSQENLLQNFWKLSREVQTMKQKTQGERVDPDTRKALHKEVESLHETFDRLMAGASSVASAARAQFEEVEGEIVSMYNTIEEKFEEYEVSLISKGAVHLGEDLELGKMETVAKQVKELSHNIHFLFKHRRPSMKNRKVVHLAMKLVDHANDVISSRRVDMAQLRMIHLLRTLLEEALFQAEETISPEEAELAMELYEIADLLYHKRENEGRLRLKLIAARLTPAQRARLEAAADQPKVLVQILLEIADGDACSEWARESTIQA